MPVDCIRDAVLTVSPKRQYLWCVCGSGWVSGGDVERVGGDDGGT